jgi:hypothetical protein
LIISIFESVSAFDIRISDFLAVASGNLSRSGNRRHFSNQAAAGHCCAVMVPRVPFSTTGGNSHPSRAPVADRDLLPFNDHRHFPRAFGEFQHLVELVRIRLDVYIVGLLAVGFPSLLGVRSA